MSAVLAAPVGLNFAEAAMRDILFNRDEQKIITQDQSREQPKLNVPGASCQTELFFGFFFDGTKNSYLDSDTPRKEGSAKLDHSNVARLYDCFPGISVPGVLPTATDWEYKPAQFSHFFRVYVPGVARRFKEIKDTAEGLADCAHL